MSALILSRRWLAASIALELVLMMAVPVAHGATPPCRVRNVTQDTYGRSLIRVVERARDGDTLRVRGTCPGEVVVDAHIVIRGKGDEPTLTGRGRTRVVRVKRGASVTVRDLTIQRGVGGGIYNNGRLTLSDLIVRRNSGGGIDNDRRMVVIGSTVRHNSGGGIINTGILRLTASLIRRNSSGIGGGILNWYSAKVTLTNSTISGNYARYSGGGIYNGDPGSGGGGETVTLIGTTVTGNVAGQGGGGIATSCGGVTLDASSSVSGNTPDDGYPTDDDC